MQEDVFYRHFKRQFRKQALDYTVHMQKDLFENTLDYLIIH